MKFPKRILSLFILIPKNSILHIHDSLDHNNYKPLSINKNIKRGHKSLHNFHSLNSSANLVKIENLCCKLNMESRRSINPQQCRNGKDDIVTSQIRRLARNLVNGNLKWAISWLQESHFNLKYLSCVILILIINYYYYIQRE